MADCKVTGRTTELTTGPTSGTLLCPECGQVMDEATLEPVDNPCTG